MPEKTTVYLESEAYRRLRALAAERETSAASLLREAVSEYVERHAPRSRARSIGAGHSGRRDVAARAEELLKGMGRRR